MLFSPAPDYPLKVKGDSMRDEGIFDGDLIGVHRTRPRAAGRSIVARLDDEITVKLLKTGGERIRLLPRNPDYAPIEVQPGQGLRDRGACIAASLGAEQVEPRRGNPDRRCGIGPAAAAFRNLNLMRAAASQYLCDGAGLA